MLKVDIHTKIVSPATRVYVARPGGNYRHYELFLDRNYIGPDLPALDLPAFDALEDIVDFEERVKRSIAFRRYSLRGERDIEPPPESLEEYAGIPSTRSFSQILRVARAYYSIIKVGDLIIMPPSTFRGAAHIGEVTSEPNQLKPVYPAIYGGQPMLGRHVEWKATIEKAMLPPQALDALQKPSPLFLLVRDAWPAIFRRAYGSYALDGEFGARFEVKSDKYQTSDDFLIQAFFNFVSTNTDRLLAGNEDLASFREGAFAAVHGITPDLYTNVNSPGGLSLKSPLITPIVIKVLFALAIVVGVAAFAHAEAGTLILGNSLGAHADQCTVPVSEQVVAQLRILGYDRWAEACAYAKAAAENTGLSTSVIIEKQ
jgi:hypothetical protein